MHTRNRARTFALATTTLIAAGLGFGGPAQADTVVSDLRPTAAAESTAKSTPDDCTAAAGVKICLPDPAYLYCVMATGERDHCAFVT